MMREYTLQYVLILAIVALVIAFSERVYVRVDATPNHVYTLSQYTKDVFDRLDENEDSVEITWLKSESVEVFAPSLQLLPDFLNEYAAFACCTVRTRASEGLSAEHLKKMGVQEHRFERRVQNKKIIESVYSALLLEYRGQSRVIPFLSDMSRLEYDIARFMQELSARPEGDIVYVCGDEATMQQQYGYLFSWMEYSGFRPALVGADTSLNVDYPLLVLGSTTQSKAQVDAIQTFLEAGGSAAFFVSGNRIEPYKGWGVLAKVADPMIAMLANLGFYIESNLIYDNRNFRIALPKQSGAGYDYIDYPFWVRVDDGASVEKKHPVCAGFQSLQFFWPGALRLAPDSGAKMLVYSSADSVLIVDDYETDLYANLSLQTEGKGREAFGLVAVKESTEALKGRMVVVADEHFPGMLIDASNADFNLDFAINCLEWLCKRDDLLQLKNKGHTNDGFFALSADRFGNIVHQSRVLNLAVIPLLLAFLALGVFIYARKKH